MCTKLEGGEVARPINANLEAEVVDADSVVESPEASSVLVESVVVELSSVAVWLWKRFLILARS